MWGIVGKVIVALWPFVREVIAGNEGLMASFKRRKMWVYLIFVQIVMFMLFLYMAEQAIHETNLNIAKKAKIVILTKDLRVATDRADKLEHFLTMNLKQMCVPYLVGASGDKPVLSPDQMNKMRIENLIHSTVVPPSPKASS